MLAVNVETDDGSANGAIRTSANKESEAYLLHPARPIPPPFRASGGRWSSMIKMRSSPLSPTTAAPPPLPCPGMPAQLCEGQQRSQYTMSGDTILYTAAASEGKPMSRGIPT